MIVLVQATVLTVGLNGKNEALQELPIRLIKVQFGTEAACSLKNERVSSVISRWDLEDMKDGLFLKRFRAARPGIPTIAVVEPGKVGDEISARSLGVSAVLTEDVGDDFFRATVASILGIRDIISIKAMSPSEEKALRKGEKRRLTRSAGY